MDNQDPHDLYRHLMDLQLSFWQQQQQLLTLLNRALDQFLNYVEQHQPNLTFRSHNPSQSDTSTNQLQTK